MRYAQIVDGVIIQTQPNPQEGFIEVPDDVVCGFIQDGDGYVAPVKVVGLEDGIKLISDLYVDAMHTLQNGYSQEEINTFPVKGDAAKAYLAGTAGDDQKYLLAKIAGVVNGDSPLTEAQITAEVNAIDAAGLANVQAKAESIGDNKRAFEFFLSKIEQRCSNAKSLLVDGEDNTGVINSLTAELAAVKASILGE